MDDLDKQLAELQLLNKTELKPAPQTPGQTGTLGKKVGPAVPPKPKKPQPQVIFIFVILFVSFFICIDYDLVFLLILFSLYRIIISWFL